MSEGNRRAHHSLVAGREIIEELLAFLALKLHVIRNNGGIVIVLILFPLPIRNIHLNPEQPVFHLPHGFVCRDRHYVNGEHQITVQFCQLRNHAVLDIRRIVFHKKNTDKLISELYIVIEAFNAVGTDIVLEIVTLARHIRHIEVKIHLLSRSVEIMQDTQSFRCVKFSAF